MTTSTERIATGIYRTYDEKGYLLCTTRLADRPTRRWIVTYTGGVNGGAFGTLRAALLHIDNRWNEEA